jgi:hypothetical protein
MKKYLVGIAVLAVAALIAVSGSQAQQSGVDKIETVSTNYVATLTTNATAAAVLPALTAGQGLYTHYTITVQSNSYVAYGRAATTSDPVLAAGGSLTWTLPAGSIDAGGPYRNTAIYLCNGAATNNGATANVTAWKVIKQR